MKLLIKYAGKRNRVIIEVSPNCLVRDLKKEIELRFRLSYIGFRLIFVLFFNTRIILTDSFPLDFFEITQGSIIEVDAYGYNKLLNRKKNRNSTYLESIGIQLKYTSPEKSEFDEVLKLCIKGDCSGFKTRFEKYILSNPEEDLLNLTHPNLWGPLHYACYYGYAEIVDYLVARHVNVNKVTTDEWTPLQLACFVGSNQCVIGLTKHKNLQINKMTKFRGTPLHLSCERDFTEIVKILIDNNAYVPLKDLHGNTPFDLACDQEILNILAISIGQEELKKCDDEKPEPMITRLWLTGAFFIHDRDVVLILNIDKGYLYRYSFEAYRERGNPELSIKIGDIQDVREETNWLFSNREEYYFVIETSNNTSKYYTKKQELTLEWIKRLKKAANYFLVHNIDDTEECEGERASPNNENTEDQPAVCESAPVHQESINLNSFETLDELGNGSFGTVYKVLKKSDPDKYFAMKCLSKGSLHKRKQLKYAISEIKIMKRLEHPFILTLHYAFQTPTEIYLILDYCPNGDLLDLIEKRQKIDEQTSKFYLAEIILALEYLHSKDIIYRDLKPANILLDEEGHVKLADFGLAKENVNSSNPARTLAGTPAYLPPETLNQQGTSKPADIYGLGPLLYEMLTGMPPYYSKDLDQLFTSIKQAHISFPPFVSIPARDLIISVMNKIPERRPTINALKHFPFFWKQDWDALKAKRIKPPKIYKARTSDFQDYHIKK